MGRLVNNNISKKGRPESFLRSGKGNKMNKKYEISLITCTTYAHHQLITYTSSHIKKNNTYMHQSTSSCLVTPATICGKYSYRLQKHVFRYSYLAVLMRRVVMVVVN